MIFTCPTIFGFPEISYNTWHVLFIMDFVICNDFLTNFVALFAYFWELVSFYIYECVDCSENQLAQSGKCKLNCTCPKAFFLQKLLAGESGQVNLCQCLICKNLPVADLK